MARAKIILIVAAVVEFIFRGLPAFVGSRMIANVFGLEYIEGALVYVHPFGALMLAFGVMFFVASRDPVKHKIAIDIGIVRYALGIVSYVVTFAMLGALATFWWIQLIVDVALLILLIFSLPRAATAE